MQEINFAQNPKSGDKSSQHPQKLQKTSTVSDFSKDFTDFTGQILLNQ